MLVAMWKLSELLASVTPAIDSEPVLQVAANGQWEQANIIPLSGDVGAAHAAVGRIADGAPRWLAMEILWPGTMFVGTAWRAERHAEAVPAATRAFATLGGKRLPEPATVGLMALLGSTPEGELESADLGAVNAWMSVGPEALWRRGEAYSSAAVDSALESRPDLVRCTHPVAAEFSVPGQPPCWVAIFVSTPQGEVHQLDRERLHALLMKVTGASR
jgi:hypothetical protein